MLSEPRVTGGRRAAARGREGWHVPCAGVLRATSAAPGGWPPPCCGCGWGLAAGFGGVLGCWVFGRSAVGRRAYGAGRVRLVSVPRGARPRATPPPVAAACGFSFRCGAPAPSCPPAGCAPASRLPAPCPRRGLRPPAPPPPPPRSGAPVFGVGWVGRHRPLRVPRLLCAGVPARPFAPPLPPAPALVVSPPPLGGFARAFFGGVAFPSSPAGEGRKGEEVALGFVLWGLCWVVPRRRPAARRAIVRHRSRRAFGNEQCQNMLVVQISNIFLRAAAEQPALPCESMATCQQACRAPEGRQ